MNHSYLRRIALLTGLLLAGCKDAPTGPLSGTITVNLAMANANDRAIMISVTGPEEISNIEAANGAYTLHSRGSGTGFKAAVFGNLGAGALVRFTVPDVGKVGSYTATIVQVSDKGNQVRTDAAGYTLTLVR